MQVAAIFGGIKFAQVLTVFFHFPPMYPIIKWLIPTSMKEKAIKHHAFTREKIDQRIEAKSSRPDFMKYILENNGPGGMTREEIDSTTMILVLAGSETSAQTLSGATYFCLKHPDKMDRLIKEIRGAFDDGDAKDITVSSLSNLPYLHAVIQETLRIHPTAPVSVPRQINRPVEICGIPVPPGVR